MKLGLTSTVYLDNSKYGIDFKRYKEYGFEYLDYQNFICHSNFVYGLNEDEFKKYFLGLKDEALKYGLKFNQLHALWDPDVEGTLGDSLPSFYIKSIKAAYYLGCPFVVIHPLSINGWNNWDFSFTKKDLMERNLKFMGDLLPYCQKYNIKLAVENLPFLGSEDFFSPMGTLEFIQAMNSDYIVMCVDTGHFNIFPDDVYEGFKKIGSKLQVLHVHDNDGSRDSHWYPFRGNFNWNGFVKGLKDIGFNGVISLETGPKSKLPQEEFEKENLSFLESVNKLKSLFD